MADMNGDPCRSESMSVIPEGLSIKRTLRDIQSTSFTAE